MSHAKGLSRFNPSQALCFVDRRQHSTTTTMGKSKKSRGRGRKGRDKKGDGKGAVPTPDEPLLKGVSGMAHHNNTSFTLYADSCVHPSPQLASSDEGERINACIGIVAALEPGTATAGTVTRLIGAGVLHSLMPLLVTGSLTVSKHATGALR